MSSFQDATLNFEGWLADEKFTLSPKIAIKDLRSIRQGRGLIAEDEIKEGEELFTIPRSSIINVSNCALVEKYPAAKEELMKLNQWEALIIVLMYELKVAKQSSKWVKYFNVLPINDTENYEFNQLMFWNKEELENLNPSLIVQRIGKDLAEAMYTELFSSFVSKTLKIDELNNITLEEYHKVASLIMSYSFDVDRIEFIREDEDEDEEDEDQEEGLGIEKDKYFKSMVPLADTLNADTKLHNAILTYHDDLLVMKSIKTIEKGEQIYNTYSEHPNSEILRRYGYIEPTGSKHDFGEITLSLIKNFFGEELKLDEKLLDESLTAIKDIINEEQDEELVDIVLDSYDCFVNHEVIMELIFIIQILTVLAEVHSVSPFDLLDDKEKFDMIKRIFIKCYQLIEGKKLTKKFLSNYKSIIQRRIDEYPPFASEDFESYSNDRKKLAEFVVKSEYRAMKSCLDIEQTFNIDGESYKFIDDEKLLRNIVKKRKGNDLDKSDKKKTKKLN